ncbi:OPT superfamily oligopeptide transporter [Mycena amicta]|nr:OPT superfamily oligopeptide transporter [Mycena amicta]
MSAAEAEVNAAIPELPLTVEKDNSKSSDSGSLKDLEKEHIYAGDEDEDVGVIDKAEDVAIQILSAHDDPELPSVTFRSVFLGLGLSAFASPQNATVSQLFCLIIAYVIGTAMHSLRPVHSILSLPSRLLASPPFQATHNRREHTFIVIMSGTASNVATGMEIIAALDLFYDPATQCRMQFYPNYISVVNLLQSLHWRGALNAKKRRFAAIFFWEWIPQYPFPLLTAFSIICLADNGRHEYVRNLFGAGSSNEGIGLLSVSTSWTLISQGTPLTWPLQTQINSFIGMWLGYMVLTGSYYTNYNQTLIITPDYKLNATALAEVGLPRYTTTYAISQLCYNLSLGSAVTYLFIWHWAELKAAFGGMRFMKRGHADVNDPHYKEMQKYPEVPQWAYLALFLVSLAVGIGCSYAGPNGTVLMPAWSIIYFTLFSAIISVVLGFSAFSISIKYAIQIMSAFIHPAQSCMLISTGNSTSFQTLYLLQDLKLGQYTKLPPRITFGSRTIAAVLKDPIGTRLWSGWVVQQYNSASELFAHGKPYWLIPFRNVSSLGSSFPLPFWLVWKLSDPKTKLAKFMKYLNLPIILLYIGWLPYSVNGQWTSCMIIGVYSQWWLRTRRPNWFAKYNYILSAALDGGSQVILFILSFAVFGASGNAVDFPYWWGNPETLSADRCMST